MIKRGDSYGITDLYVSSITYAMRGQKLLSSNGIKSRIKRNINKTKPSGCGYVLSVSENDADIAARILENNNIKLKEAH